MNKEELVKEVAARSTKKTGLQISQAVAKACLDETIAVIEEKAKKREDVVLVGFGTFSTADRAGRDGRNPRTKEAIKIPAKVAPVFRPGKIYRECTSKLKAKVKNKKK